MAHYKVDLEEGVPLAEAVDVKGGAATVEELRAALAQIATMCRTFENPWDATEEIEKLVRRTLGK